MRYFYDDEHDSLMITFRDADYAESEEIYDGFVMDFDTAGRPMGIDIYSQASKFIDIPRLLRDFTRRPEPVITPVATYLRDAPAPSRKRRRNEGFAEVESPSR